MSYTIMDMNLDENITGCKNFKWHEMLKLRDWDVYVFPESDLVRQNCIKTISVLQKIRDQFNKPLSITSGYRPAKYNKLIGGSKFSSHLTGRAVDFFVHGMHCDDVRDQLINRLEILDIRLEDLPGSNWVHIDLDVRSSGNRYFKP